MDKSTNDNSDDDKRLQEGRMTLLAAALAFEGLTIALWSFASIVVIVLVIVVILYGR